MSTSCSKITVKRFLLFLMLKASFGFFLLKQTCKMFGQLFRSLTTNNFNIILYRVTLFFIVVVELSTDIKKIL